LRTFSSQSDRHSYLSIKLSLISIAILSVVVSFYVYFSYKDLVAVIDQQYADQAQSVVAIANASVQDADILKNDAYMQQVSEKIVKAYPNILSASFYAIDRHGNPVRLANGNHKKTGEAADPKYIDPVKSGNMTRQEMVTEGGGHVMEVLAPIYVNDRPAASLVMHMNLKQKDIALRRYMLRALLYALAGLFALAPVLYVRFRREVFSPVRRLIEGAREVAKGNLDERVKLERKDELGKLSQEFDNMTEAIQQREEETLQELAKIKRKWDEAEAKSRTDFLTELDNHRSFRDRLDAELNRASRLEEPVSLLFCDLDNFKDFNDSNGHLLGDRALFDTAEIIKYSIRNYDIAARYGGEEFVVVLPDTNSADAVIVAERIRHNLELYEFVTKEGSGKLTISIGVATYPSDAEDSKGFISAADYAMYQSKSLGKNCVTVFNPAEDISTSEAS